MSDDLQQEFMAKFKEEADELVERLNQGLMALEEDPGNQEWLQDIARAAHTLKGTSSMMGVDAVAEIAHGMEDVLVLVRDRELDMSANLGDMLFAGLDAIQVSLNKLIGLDTDKELNVANLCKQIRQFMTGESSVLTKPEAAVSDTSAQDQPVEKKSGPAPLRSPEEQISPITLPEPIAEKTHGLDEFLGIFRAEAEELLEVLNRGALNLEEQPDNLDLIGEMARAAHTLKGSAKMMGFDDISAIGHKLEDRLTLIRDGQEKMTPEIGDLIFSSLDGINMSLSGGISELDELDREPKTDIDTQTIVKTRKSLEHDEPEPGPPESISDRAPLASAFGRAPTTAAPSSSAQSAAPEPGPLTLMEGSDISLIETLAPRATTTPVVTIMQETIRVDTAKVDELVNMAGEMVVNQIRFEDGLSMLKKLLAANKEQQQKWHHVRDAFVLMRESSNGIPEHLFEALQKYGDGQTDFNATLARYFRHVADDTIHLSLMTGDLQKDVMSLRMMPVSSVFESFRRTIRDIAREMGKLVRAEIRGQETEIDKKMIEGIKDPLVHLVRNAIDHGIETPEERERAGKPREGKVRLSARGEGDHIIIEIEDDGRGLNAESIKNSAIRKGVVTPEEASTMSERDSLHLVFRPNFSTRADVTEYSGRGVGMDVVKTNIEGLKGEVHIETELGRGTKFVLMLPLTLAVTRVLFVECESNTFAIPTSSVLKTAKINVSEIKSIERREAVQILGRTVPLVNLNDVLFLTKRSNQKDDKLSVIILQYAGEYIGFVVDKVVGEQEIVIKELGVHLQEVPNLAGAAVLGSGDVVVVLHVPELFASSKKTARSTAVAKTVKPVPAAVAQRILVVEDSLATRELERNILAAQGYDVHVASNGVEGLQRMSTDEYDLVVTDISMPQMDGFQMIARIKENRDWMHIPVVIVSGNDSSDERRRGLELGVEGFVVKTAFDQSGLLDTIQRLIGDA